LWRGSDREGSSISMSMRAVICSGSKATCDMVAPPPLQTGVTAGATQAWCVGVAHEASGGQIHRKLRSPRLVRQRARGMRDQSATTDMLLRPVSLHASNE
jgi:hypothetical protein